MSLHRVPRRGAVFTVLGLVVSVVATEVRSSADCESPEERPEAPTKASGDGPGAIPDGERAPDLRQGWGRGDQMRFYYTSQGSRLLPYSWFLALERPDSDEPFRAPENMRRMRFVVEPGGGGGAEWNPDGLPVGFVMDHVPAMPAPDASLVRALLGEEYDPETYPKTEKWMGLTCAACHTGQVEVGGRLLRVDGGPAMADVQTFLEDLTSALRETSRDEAKRERFSRLVLGPGTGAEDREALGRELATFSKLLDAYGDRNASPGIRYGFGRLDAFGRILNQVSHYGLGIRESRFDADAPVSYPALWETPYFDWVQYNASASDPLSRNLGEVLGVFADFRLTPPDEDRFKSSARLHELFLLEEWVKSLEAPKWPRGLGGAFEIDEDLAGQGSRLYDENCRGCHSLRGEDGYFPRNTAFQGGRDDVYVIKTSVVDFRKVGTDPTFIKNFGKPGKSGDLFDDQEASRRLPEVPRPLLLGAAVTRIIDRKLIEEGFERDSLEYRARLDQLNSFHKRPEGEGIPLGGLGYKARPLDGVWATGPFLHNGSVPNLDELLKPAADRAKTFHVGSWRLDPEKVGFVSGPGENTFEFRTDIPGNLNIGHEGRHYTQTRGEDGEFRDFTAAERRALIEFIKTIE